MAVDQDRTFQFDELSTTSASGNEMKHTSVSVRAASSQLQLGSNKRKAQEKMDSKDRNRHPVHDVKLEVSITRERQSANACTAWDIEGSGPDSTFAAEMTLSTWTYNYQRYFTIILSPSRDHFFSTQSRFDSIPTRSAPMIYAQSTEAQLHELTVPPECPSCGYIPLSMTSSVEKSPLSLLESPFGLSTQAVERPLFSTRKLVRMKDAMLDATQIPVIAMWGDGSLVTYNKAVCRLLGRNGDPMSESASTVLSQMQVYTEDFTRPLEQSEYPIVQLCRARKGIPGLRFGIIDAKARRRVFECGGSAIHNEETGEFQGVISAWKEVTWYVNAIKDQGLLNETQFQLICEKIPQMVS